MEPAELIVNAWLQMKGYFLMTNLRVDRANEKGGKKPEIDILAIKLKKNKKEVEEKLHVEITVAVNPFGKWNKEHIKKNIRKFDEEERKSFIKEYIGENYKKLLVISDKCIPKNDKEFENILKKNGIEYIRFSEIIKELKEMMKGKSYDDSTRRFLGLIFEHENIKKEHKEE